MIRTSEFIAKNGRVTVHLKMRIEHKDCDRDLMFREYNDLVDSVHKALSDQFHCLQIKVK